MKLKYALFALIVSMLPSNGAITLSTQFGQAFDSSGAPVADGTLWALVVDDGNDTFAGFGLNSSLSATTAGTADTFFSSGQKFGLGTVLGGGTVFAMGRFNGTDSGLAGLLTGSVGVTLGDFGTASGQDFVFYWFPGAQFVAGPEQTIADQAGGINTTSNDGIFNIGMTLPADGALVSTGAATSGDAGGSLNNAAFTAVNLVTIPEPSAALLGALGAFGLLRRRRN